MYYLSCKKLWRKLKFFASNQPFTIKLSNFGILQLPKAFLTYNLCILYARLGCLVALVLCVVMSLVWHNYFNCSWELSFAYFTIFVCSFTKYKVNLSKSFIVLSFWKHSNFHFEWFYLSSYFNLVICILILIM